MCLCFGVRAPFVFMGEPPISVEDLLYAVFVQSADEAANILAAAVSGDIDAFIKKR